MPIASTTTPRIQYAGSGTTGPFNTVFVFINSEDLKVTRTSTLGVNDVLVIDTDYTVTGGSSSSGTVTLTSNLAVGELLTIQRQTVLTQEVDYVANDRFPAEAHEGALNKLTLITQELSNKFNLVPTFSDTSVITDLNFPEPEALQYLRWNSAGTDLENVAGTVSGGGGTMNNVSDDLNPKLGGNLHVNGFYITSTAGNDLNIQGGNTADININVGSSGDLNIAGDTNIESESGSIINVGNNIDIESSSINLNSDEVLVDSFIKHSGDTDTNIQFTTDTITHTAGGTSVFNITDEGIQLASGIRIDSILDDDTLNANSDTSLATQQSIKTYVDNQISNVTNDLTSVLTTDDISFESEASYTLDFTTYSKYIISIIHLRPSSTGGPRLVCDMSDDDGSTYASTASYLYYSVGDEMKTNITTGIATDKRISHFMYTNSSSFGYTANIELTRANIDGSEVFVKVHGIGTNYHGVGEGFSGATGIWTADDPINRVKLYFDSGNLGNQGIIRVFRIT